MEVWKQIPQCEDYEVSTAGNWRRVGALTNYTIKVKDKKGKRYAVIVPWINGKRRQIYLHRAIAMAFLPNYHNKPQVDHKNGNSLDNRLWNLKWATASENNLNRPGWGKSGTPKGVYRVGDRFKAVFRSTVLGYYDTEDEARAAYVEAGTAYSSSFRAQ